MSVIVRDDGFHNDDFTGASLDIAPETDAGYLPALIDGAEMIRVLFPTFSDGRGFSLARRIRALGYTGRLRAAGPLIVASAPRRPPLPTCAECYIVVCSLLTPCEIHS